MHKSVIYSISSKPGIFGKTLYNHLFDFYSIPYVYIPVSISDENTFSNILDLFLNTDMFYGLSISMPYKLKAYKFFSTEINSILTKHKFPAFNTLKKSNNSIEGALTDINIYEEYKYRLDSSIKKIMVYGQGAMGQLAMNFFTSNNYICINLTRSSLKQGLLNCFDNRETAFINASPVNIEELILDRSLNFPVLDLPVRLEQKYINEMYFSGLWATKIQFRNQFKFYTGNTINSEELDLICNRLFFAKH